MNKKLPVNTVAGVITGSEPTMSSLEMVDYINAGRKAKAEAEGLAFPCKKYPKLRHDNFMKKVPKVLGELAPKFSGTNTYISGKGVEQVQEIYNFPPNVKPA